MLTSINRVLRLVKVSGLLLLYSNTGFSRADEPGFHRVDLSAGLTVPFITYAIEKDLTSNAEKELVCNAKRVMPFSSVDCKSHFCRFPYINCVWATPDEIRTQSVNWQGVGISGGALCEVSAKFKDCTTVHPAFCLNQTDTASKLDALSTSLNSPEFMKMKWDRNGNAKPETIPVEADGTPSPVQ